MTAAPLDLDAMETLAANCYIKATTVYDNALRDAAPALIAAARERDALRGYLEQARHELAVTKYNEQNCLAEIARLEAKLAASTIGHTP